MLWADPESGTVIAFTSQIGSELPAPYEFYHLADQAAHEISEHFRQQSAEA